MPRNGNPKRNKPHQIPTESKVEIVGNARDIEDLRFSYSDGTSRLNLINQNSQDAMMLSEYSRNNG
jgi:hypothetical protein